MIRQDFDTKRKDKHKTTNQTNKNQTPPRMKKTIQEKQTMKKPKIRQTTTCKQTKYRNPTNIKVMVYPNKINIICNNEEVIQDFFKSKGLTRTL